MTNDHPPEAGRRGSESAADGSHTPVSAEIHGFSRPGAAPTPWSVALEQITAAETFWLSTVRPDGRPHVTPLIAVWDDDAIWFATGPDERKALNLVRNRSVVLTTGQSALAAGALDIVLEGVAEQVTDDAELEPVAVAFAAKYGREIWDYSVRDGAFDCRPPTKDGTAVRAIVFRLRAARGLGFRKGDEFSQTTWRFAR